DGCAARGAGVTARGPVRRRPHRLGVERRRAGQRVHARGRTGVVRPMRRTLLVASVAMTMAMPRAAAAPPEPSQPNPLEDARKAAASMPFSGRVEVEWRDSAGLHRTALDV